MRMRSPRGPCTPGGPVANSVAVAKACEMITNQVYLCAYGSIESYAIGFIALMIVLYRVLFS